MVSDRRSLGERLKRQRERRGITLAEISQTSKVPVSLFTGLEAGDCSRWPASVYARAYVKSYAAAIGLNADEVVEEFSTVFGLRSETGEPLPPPAGAPSRLRLSLVQEPAVSLTTVSHRAGLAATELLIGFLIAAVAHAGLGASVWVTVGLVLAYSAGGRLLTDEPLLYFLYRTVRAGSARPALREIGSPSAEVAPVGDAASTVA